MKKNTLSLLAIFTCGLSVATFYNAKGTASFYADKLHGRRTASGEAYHRDSLTAAHRTLPFGTKILVTNLDNDSTVILRVNDRLGTDKRIIDVSMAGALQLDFVRKGLTKVRIETIDDAN